MSLWNCEICGNMFTYNIILEHIRLMHPDVEEADYGKWPDGEPVVYTDEVASLADLEEWWSDGSSGEMPGAGL